MLVLLSPHSFCQFILKVLRQRQHGIVICVLVSQSLRVVSQVRWATGTEQNKRTHLYLVKKMMYFLQQLASFGHSFASFSSLYVSSEWVSHSFFLSVAISIDKTKYCTYVESNGIQELPCFYRLGMRWMNPVRRGWPDNMYKYMFVCLSTISSEHVGGLLVLCIWAATFS